jgi:hypothetical protein
MKKELKKVGMSVGFVFNKEEQKVHNLEIGDVIDIKEFEVIKKEGAN